MSPQTGSLAAGESTYHFADQHVPVLWASLIPEFGRVVQYQPDGDPSQAADITVIWKEGAEDEDVSPGRYSHALVRHSDLARPPKLGDLVLHSAFTYVVVRVDAYPYGVSTVVLHDETESL